MGTLGLCPLELSCTGCWGSLRVEGAIIVMRACRAKHVSSSLDLPLVVKLVV
jgi:hypothetical protein